MRLETLIPARSTWAIATGDDGQPMVGPLASLGGRAPDVTVTAIEPGEVPVSIARETIHVRENAQQFDVTYHDFAGYRGLYHQHGRNWIIWTEDRRHIFVARGPEAWARTWVYARFVLRHFIVARFLRRTGYRRIHAVAGALAGGEALVIAGPYLSGKTFLLEGLIAADLAREIVEDDCAVLSPDWEVYCLLPAEAELRRTRSFPVRALVCLDRAAPTIAPLDPSAAARWAMAIQASWPLSWLPGAGEIATTPGHCPPDLRCLRAPERPALADIIPAITPLLA